MGDKASFIKKEIERAAREAALACHLPLKLSELREFGRIGSSKAFAEGKHKSLGLPFDRYVASCIFRETFTGAKNMNENQDKRDSPSQERITEALRTFSAKEWQDLINDSGSGDLDPLREHLDARAEALARELGREKYLSIYGAALSRWAALWERPWMGGIEISAPVRAALLWRRYRELNAARAPRPEDAHAAIARTLSHDGVTWTARRVKLMLDRMREDAQMKAFIDRDGLEPNLEGDAHGRLLYWTKGLNALRQHHRRQGSAE